MPKLMTRFALLAAPFFVHGLPVESPRAPTAVSDEPGRVVEPDVEPLSARDYISGGATIYESLIDEQDAPTDGTLEDDSIDESDSLGLPKPAVVQSVAMLSSSSRSAPALRSHNQYCLDKPCKSENWFSNSTWEGMPFTYCKSAPPLDT